MENKASPGGIAILRLGFYLAQTGVTCTAWPQLSYRGVNRLADTLDADDIDDLHESGQHRLADLWDQHWDVEDSGVLQQDIELARRFQREFLQEGVEHEIIYVELSEIPADLERYPSARLWNEQLALALKYFENRVLPERPRQLLDSLGYDLSTLHDSFHSAIYQPGFHLVCPDLPASLNRSGLFDGLQDARRFLRLAHEMDYGPLPFCIMAVWEVG